MGTTLTPYFKDFCVIDASNLFVCSTMADEVLLFCSDSAVQTTLILQCAALDIVMDSERALRTYSGGEQAMMCCLLVSLLLPPQSVQILFVQVLEALSPANVRRMTRTFRSNAPQALLFTLADTGPVPHV